MGARVEGLIDAGPYEKASYFASDEAAKQVSHIAEQLHSCLNNPAPTPPPPQTLVVMTTTTTAHAAPGLDQSTGQLIKELLSRLLPSNWPDFFANLIILVLLSVFLYGAYQLYCCLFSFRRRGPRSRPYLSQTDYSDVSAVTDYLQQ